jgi:GT2 family glycosyltransferase
MLINKKKFKNKYFDENFFLYLENNDLCKRVKSLGENIYVIKNSLVKHLGASSANSRFSDKIEYLRNWHWMWSKYFYNKKHYGFFVALFKVMPNLFSSVFKYLFFSFFVNAEKKMIYKMRFLGIINSIFNKKSWMRIENII